MPWYRKEQPTPFDAIPIEGLAFFNGSVLAERYQQTWLREKKYPHITFPSALQREFRSGSRTAGVQSVHVFGAFDLPYHNTRDEAFGQIQTVAAEQGVQVLKQQQEILTVTNPASGRGYHIHYDNRAKHMIDVVAFPVEAMELLDGQSRALLPELYHNERVGLEAVAPVKFFTPDSNWTWYPTEFDGDDLFFGLVAGFVVELGSFSLSELESLRGPWGLPLERDRSFQPQSLADLKRTHEQR